MQELWDCLKLNFIWKHPRNSSFYRLQKQLVQITVMIEAGDRKLQPEDSWILSKNSQIIVTRCNILIIQIRCVCLMSVFFSIFSHVAIFLIYPWLDNQTLVVEQMVSPRSFKGTRLVRCMFSWLQFVTLPLGVNKFHTRYTWPFEAPDFFSFFFFTRFVWSSWGKNQAGWNITINSPSYSNSCWRLLFSFTTCVVFCCLWWTNAFGNPNLYIFPDNFLKN